MSAPQNSPARPLKIDIVSDVMCPWCYIGEKNLKQALENYSGSVEIFWRPYQLDPTLPEQGKDRKTYLNEKFGGEERAKELYKRVEDAGSAVGIDFQFDKIAVSPNTLNAHRLIRWAGGVSREAQSGLVERLFEIYFLEGGNIGDVDLLVEVAGKFGLDQNLVRELLNSDKDKPEVEAEIDHARRMGINGVPCFIIDDKFALMGAQPPQALLQALDQALSSDPENG